MVVVSFDFEVPHPPGLDSDALGALAARIADAEGIDANAGLAILVTTDQAMQALNRDYRGRNEPTDVLSFPGARDGLPPGIQPMLGDIAISAPAAERQAREHDQPLQREVEHLLVHALLHLCGWDHEDGPEAMAAIRAREEEFLGDLSWAHAGA